MNTSITPPKITPPTYIVKSPGLSANSKQKTPTSEFLQKPNRSVSKSSVDKENTRFTPAEKAPRTTQKSNKNTPSEEYLNSASRNRFASANRDKVSNTSKSPFSRADPESAHESARKFQTPVQEAPKSLARSKQGTTDSKHQSASAKLPESLKKFAQKNLLEARSASKIGTKSVDKDFAARLVKTVEKSRNEGKLSTHSDNLYTRTARDASSGRQRMEVSRPIMEEENEMDYSREEKKHIMHLRQNLENVLDDVNMSIQMTAQQIKESPHKGTPKLIGSAGKRQVENAADDEDEREVKLENEMEVEGLVEEKDKTERKEYSVYEDWRILDTIDDLLERGEAKSLSSRVLWSNIIDPLTGLKLLDGRRSSESMRDRYKRYISCLDEAGKAMIKDFCDTNKLPDMKRNHCTFKKVDGQRQLTGISSQLNYNPERISRKTPYGTKSKKKSPDAKEPKKGRKKSEGETKRGKSQFEEEHEELTLRNRVEGVPFRADDIEEVTQTETKVVRMYGGQRDLGRQVVITKDYETVVKKRPEEKKAIGFSMTSTNVPVREKAAARQDRPGFIHSDSFQDSRLTQRMGDVVRMSEQMKASKKRKAEDNTDFGDVGRKDLKQVKTNNAHEDQHIPLNGLFQSRKPAAKLGTDLENFTIYVDLTDGYRLFVQEESEDEEENEIEAALKELANAYKVDFSQVVTVFSKVSCDYKDLEEYLQTRDNRLLWNEEEDADLLNDDRVAIKYLKMMKGEERVIKRKEYLLAMVE